MAQIKDWSTTAASNNSAPPDGAPEGMLPSAVNNVIRENMASVRTWFENSEWINYGHSGTQASGTTFTIATDLTATYTSDRAIQIVDSSTLYGFVVSSTYSAPNTTVTVELLTGSLTTSMNGETVSLGAIKPSNDSLPKNYKYGLHVYAADAEASDTYVITLTPTPIALETGMVIHFKANTANTGAATLNVNSIGAVTIKKNYDSDLADNDIKANQIVSVIYDGTNFQMISPVSNTGGGISNVVEDTTPQLGGNLDVNGNKITSASSGNIDIEPNGTGNVLIGNFTFDADQTVGAGQDDYVLTYDNTGGLISLEAAGGGGAWSLVTSTTASGASEVTFTGLDSTAHVYEVRYSNVTFSTDGTSLRLRMSTDNGSTYDSGASDYDRLGEQLRVDAGTESEFFEGDESGDHINLVSGGSVGSAANEELGGCLTIMDPSDASYTKASWTSVFTNATPDFGFATGGGQRRTTTAVNAIQLYPSAGTVSGDFRLYKLSDT